jgi:hypothetical protein
MISLAFVPLYGGSRQPYTRPGKGFSLSGEDKVYPVIQVQPQTQKSRIRWQKVELVVRGLGLRN